MAEMSRVRAIEHLERHSYWTSDDYSWIDDVCDKAISDMEKLEKIEKILEESEGWHDDTCHALNRIEQIVKEVE